MSEKEKRELTAEELMRLLQAATAGRGNPKICTISDEFYSMLHEPQHYKGAETMIEVLNTMEDLYKANNQKVFDAVTKVTRFLVAAHEKNRREPTDDRMRDILMVAGSQAMSTVVQTLTNVVKASISNAPIGADLTPEMKKRYIRFVLATIECDLSRRFEADAVGLDFYLSEIMAERGDAKDIMGNKDAATK